MRLENLKTVDMKSKGKIIIAVVLFLFLIMVVCTATYNHYYKQNMAPDDHPTSSTIIIVKEGETISNLSYNLYEKKLIRDPGLLKIYSKLYGKVLHKGAFEIQPGSTSKEIYELITSTNQIDLKVTIPEGKTVREIANILENSNLADSQTFMHYAKDGDIIATYNIPSDSLNGYLFPDTYFIPYGFTEKEIIELMVNNFFSKIDVIYPYWEDFTPSQLHEKVVMASIIEKEYRVDAEASIIASVFYNRLNSWYKKLESCATVVYIMTEEEGLPKPNRIFYSDLERESPYNTYIFEGLPPGAISNPGSVSLNGAFYPDQTDYIYFVVDDIELGTHSFSSSYEDFEKNKNKYLENFMAQ